MKPLLCCLFLFLCVNGKAGVFDVVKSLPAKERIARTQQIYDQQVRPKDSVTAMQYMNELMEIAGLLQDKSFLCFSTSLLADQYARARRDNPLSTQLHHEAIEMAEQYRLPLMVGICSFRLGRYYYNFKNYPLAFEFMLRADNIFKEIGYTQVPDMDGVLFFIGSTYYETGDLEKAESFLQRIQTLERVGKYVAKQSLNTLGLIKRTQNDTTAALKYFQRALDTSVAQNDSTWIGICYSNIGTLYFFKKRYDLAYRMLQSAARLNTKNRQWPDAYGNNLLLARMDIADNHIAQAQQKIDSARALQLLNNQPIARKLLYETLVMLYKQTSQLAKALDAEQQLLLVKDSLSISKDHQAYEKILLRMETEKHLNEIDKIEAAAKSSAQQRNTIILVLALTVIVLALIYNRGRLKSASEAKILQGEKLRAEEQLKNAREMLTSFTENSRQKNELIEQFANELQRLKSNLTGDPLYEERLQNFDKLIHSTILTDAEWDGFCVLFDKVHKDFFKRLAQKLPGLSLNDTRLISLVKLDLNNLETARMLGMNESAVAEAKQRLRKKIHPGEDGLGLEDLVNAI